MSPGEINKKLATLLLGWRRASHLVALPSLCQEGPEACGRAAGLVTSFATSGVPTYNLMRGQTLAAVLLG